MSGLIRIPVFNFEENEIILQNVFAKCLDNYVEVRKSDDGTSWQLYARFTIYGSRNRANQGRPLTVIHYNKTIPDASMTKDPVRLISNLFKQDYSAVDD